MPTLTLLFLEIALCLALSLAALALLKPLLREILTETCGTAGRAAFWVRFTELMVVIAPLLIVIYFAPTQELNVVNLAYALQQTLFRTLLGIFIALALIGRVIWRAIRSPLTPTGASLRATEEGGDARVA